MVQDEQNFGRDSVAARTAAPKVALPVVALVVRTRRLLWVSTLILSVVTLVIAYLPGTEFLDFTPLPLLAALIATMLLYVLSTELAKKFFYTHEAL